MPLMQMAECPFSTLFVNLEGKFSVSKFISENGPNDGKNFAKT